MLILTVLVFGLAVAAVVSAGNNPAPVAVYVYAMNDRDGFVTDQRRELLKSVQDVQEMLRRETRIVLTASKGAACLLIEVNDRSRYTVIEGCQGVRVGVTLHVGDYATHVARTGPPGAWKETAGLIAAQVSQWVKDNRARLACGQKSSQADSALRASAESG